MKDEPANIDKDLAELNREAETIHKHIPQDAPSFTATVEDRNGWDAIPCSLFVLLNTLYFPDCLVAISKPESGDKAVMWNIMSMMMLAAMDGVTLKFQCNTDPKTFEVFRQCVGLLFRRTDKPGYGETYDECSKILRACKDKGCEHLLQELSRVTQLEGRTPILHCIPGKNPS